MLRLRIRYADPATLVRDFEQQFGKGGVLVRVEPPAETRLFDAVELELVTLAGVFVLPAQVVQHVRGVGVALSFDPTDARLAAAVEEARDAGETAGGPPVHEFATATASEAESGDADVGHRLPGHAGADPGVGTNIAGLLAAKIHAAKHGNKEERMRIMREGDRKLHRFVLSNPGLRLDEVTFIAKLSTVSADLLIAIAERRDWIARPEIALALVRNPKTPVPLAIQLLQHIAPAELRRLAKGSSLRMPILQAARKRVVG